MNRRVRVDSLPIVSTNGEFIGKCSAQMEIMMKARTRVRAFLCIHLCRSRPLCGSSKGSVTGPPSQHPGVFPRHRLSPTFSLCPYYTISAAAKVNDL
mgnify:CR=1 FL=1